MKFCHLHLHTEYSMLDGYCRLEPLFEMAEELQMDAIAITDHHNVSGIINFYILAQNYGIKPIIGVELNVESVLSRNSSKRYHLTVLAKDNLGYRTILQLLTCSNLQNDGLINVPMLEAYHQGIIGLSGCAESELSEWIKKDPTKALRVAQCYRDLLGQNNYYVELQRFGLSGEEEVIQRKLKLAQKLGIPVVATNNVHYLKRGDSEIHLTLSSIQKLSLEAAYPEKKEMNTT